MEQKQLVELYERSANAHEEKLRLRKERVSLNKVGSEWLVGNMMTFDSTVDMKNYYGKVIVMDFWASWCSPCLEKIPEFYKLSDEYKSKDIVFLLISIDDDLNQWKEAALRNNWRKNSFWIGSEDNDNPIYWYTYSESKNEEGEFSVLSTLPKYVIISKEGSIEYNSGLSKNGFGDFKNKISSLIQL